MKINPTGFLETTLPVFLPLKYRLAKNPEILRILLRDGDQLIAESYTCPTKSHAPILLLLHGLTGSSQSNYIQTVGSQLNQQYHIVALNFRNAGRGLGLASRMYHSGLWQDIEDVVMYLKLKFPRREINCAGFSLGGNVLIKFLANSQFAAEVKSAVAVSAPINLHATVLHMQKNCMGLFERYFMLELKKLHTVIGPYLKQKANFKKFPSTMLEFDHEFTAKQWGFDSGLDYYQKSSSLPDIVRIKTKLHIIHAANDPIVPFEPLVQVRQTPIKTSIFRYGGHVGFHHPRHQTPLLPQLILEGLRSN